MDASRYLRLKTASCPQTIARNQCVSAGQRTAMLAVAATTTYVSPNNTKDTLHAQPCAIIKGDDGSQYARTTSKVAYNSDYVTPVMPSQRCPSTGVCNDIANRYSAPFITLPGCPMPSTTATYLSPCATECYQCPPGLAATAEAKYLCCHPNANMNTSG